MDMYTQGPWIWVDRWLVPAWDQDAIKSPGSSAIADDGSAYGEYGSVIDPKGANARLIAAAPELLEALEEVLDEISGRIELDSRTRFRVKSAIRKALGEEK